ncbi:MAG TPA: hypothetical protein VK558_14340 [Patescibacteria group bacterium]|nr:hypothetical protein [Patescibacteria group bacterium]
MTATPARHSFALAPARRAATMALTALAVLLAGAADSMASVTLVVVEARGVKLEAGQVVDGSQSLVLLDGQQVTLMSPEGRMLKLRGPSDKPPAPGEAVATADMAAALQSLVTQNAARTDKTGVVRSGGKEVVPPEAWLLDVSSSGIRCLPEGSPVTFWRPQAGEAVSLVIAPSDRSWRVRADWPKGADRLTLPGTIPLRKRSTYVVRVGDNEIMLTVVALPAALDNDAMRAGWMLDVGCNAQVHALLKQQRK